MMIRVIKTWILILCNSLIFAQAPAGSNQQIQFNENGSFGASSMLRWDGTNVRLGDLGGNSAKIRFESEAGDRSYIFSENWGTNKNRLVIETQNDGDDDYTVFRNMHYNNGNKDVFEIHRSWTMANSHFYVMNGNVGIGTDTPSNIQGWGKVLDVRGSGHSKILTSTSGAAYLTGIYSHSSWYGGGGFIGTESNHNLHLISNYKPRMSILTNGYVGIGTTSPTEKLEVVGNIKADRMVKIDGHGSVASLQIMDNSNSNTVNVLFRGDGGKSYIKSGKLGIGTTNPTEELEVAGTIYSREVKVEVAAGTGPDYVFEPDYDLRSLEETAAYIKSNKHLPEIPSAKEMEANGIQLGEMNMLLLKKIEELTLHTIEQQKLIEAQNTMLSQQNKRIEKLEMNQQ
ncbi:hypothetical protein [Ekhidna sp.]|uniref:hypothetical protein n=1 Tax=Ekhidna sp. TaxID=2608089 RepID=UPI003BAD35E1